jgi:hypothetical protein
MIYVSGRGLCREPFADIAFCGARQRLLTDSAWDHCSVIKCGAVQAIARRKLARDGRKTSAGGTPGRPIAVVTKSLETDIKLKRRCGRMGRASPNDVRSNLPLRRFIKCSISSAQYQMLACDLPADTLETEMIGRMTMGQFAPGLSPDRIVEVLSF